MKKSNLNLMLCLVSVVSLSSPAWADTAGGGGNSGVNTAVDGALMVTRVGGAGCGMLVGTPVAVVRETYKLYTTWTPAWADHVGGKDCAPACALASIVSVPASMIWGTCLGAFHGCKNGLVKGFNAPFNPESFSLGNEYEK